MNLLRISKYVICIVLCSCLLFACDTSGVGSTSSLTDMQQKDVFSPVPTRSIWANMGEQFQLTHDFTRPEVITQIAFLQAHKEDLYKILESSAPYISYVYEETKKRGLPAELVLLPIVESEYNANARSKKGARGMWQFMPATAIELGLKSNQAYDGRKDTIAATSAALNYLTNLHQAMQDDWLLAMAAYNYGPGNVQNAIDRQKKWYARTSFWSLHLPRETKTYAPKVLALAAVIKNPARYGIKLPPVHSGPQLASVQLNSPAELKQLSTSSGVSMATLKHLNPAYRDLAATTKGAPNKFLVPVENPQLALQQSPLYHENKMLLNAIFKESGWLSSAFPSLPVNS